MKFRDLLAKLVVLDEETPQLPLVELPEPPASSAPGPGELSLGEIDLAAVYRRAAIPDAPFSAEQALETLSSLPLALPAEARQQALRSVLEAMSQNLRTTPEAVLEDAARKVKALLAESEEIGRKVAEFTAAAQAEIATREEQIRVWQKAIVAARAEEQRLTQKCRAEADRLELVPRLYGFERAGKPTY